MDRHDRLNPEERPEPTVWLDGARCRRCGPSSRELPAGNVRIVCYPRGYNMTGRIRHMRVFLCPECRTDVWEWVSVDEAMRLFAEGVAVRRYSRSGDAAHTPLTEDELIEFARSLATRTDLARLALDS